MKIVYCGGNQAGCIGLLTLLALRHNIIVVVTQSKIVSDVASLFRLPVEKSIHSVTLRPDLIVNAHGREFIPDAELKQAKSGGINVHPCLYKFSGADPIGRMLNEKITRASVGCHRMTQKLDTGDVLCERYIDVEGTTRQEIYNELYPLYPLVLAEGLRKCRE